MARTDIWHLFVVKLRSKDVLHVLARSFGECLEKLNNDLEIDDDDVKEIERYLYVHAMPRSYDL